MPNGQCYRPYRLPGKYCCIVCRDLKDAEEFYKDSSRYNGCCSRCKVCDNMRYREERSGPDVKVSASPVKRTSVDNRWSDRQTQKRIDDIKSTGVSRVIQSTETRVVKKDKDGAPLFRERVTRFEDGSMEVMFEKVSQVSDATRKDEGLSKETHASPLSDPLSSRDARIVKDYKAGASQIEIRQREKIHTRTLKTILTEAGVHIRSTGEQRALKYADRPPKPKPPPHPRVYFRDDKWTEPEIAILKKMGPVATLEQIQKTLPKPRTLTAIKIRRKRLKIPSPNRSGVHTKRSRRAWTNIEIKVLREMVAAGKTDEHIHKRLKHRTPAGIAKKRKDLNLKGTHTPRLNPQCPKMVAQLIKLKMAGFTQTRIAEMFEVRSNAVSTAFKRIGISFPRAKRKKLNGCRRWTDTEVALLHKSLKKYWRAQPIDKHITYTEMVLHVAPEFPHRTRHALMQKVKVLTRYWHITREQEARKQKEAPPVPPTPPPRPTATPWFLRQHARSTNGGYPH